MTALQHCKLTASHMCAVPLAAVGFALLQKRAFVRRENYYSLVTVGCSGVVFGLKVRAARQARPAASCCMACFRLVARHQPTPLTTLLHAPLRCGRASGAAAQPPTGGCRRASPGCPRWRSATCACRRRASPCTCLACWRAWRALTWSSQVQRGRGTAASRAAVLRAKCWW